MLLTFEGFIFGLPGSGPTGFLEGLLEHLIEHRVFRQRAFQEFPDIIHVPKIHHQVHALVEGRHVVHGPALLAKENHKDIATNTDGKL